jgi:2-oxoglutarate ferredoxin oxidoreductase subunit gamma
VLSKIVFAGFGGQGVLVAGYAVASAAMGEGKYVTYLPSYGAEQRGGTANCTVSIADEEIASPIASAPDCAVVMNQPSLIRVRNQVAPRGKLLLNTTLVSGAVERDDVDVFYMPATKMAEEMGNIAIANMVILGGFLGITNYVKLSSVLTILKDIFPPHRHKMIKINESAIQAGFDHMKQVK